MGHALRPYYLMISSYFPTIAEPWRCSFVYDQVRAIQKVSPGYEVVVIKTNFEGNYEFRGVRVIGFKTYMTGRWVCPWLLNKLNECRMWRLLSAEGIAIQDIAVVHCQLIPDAYLNAAIKRRKPQVTSIIQFQDADPYAMICGSSRLRTISYFMYHRAMAERADILIAISDNVARVVREAPRQTVHNTYPPMAESMRILKNFKAARVKRICILHNGVDRTVFKPDVSHHKDPNTFTIGCVAVFRDLKDQITLLQAVNRIRDKIRGMRVKLVGVHHSGTMLEDCKKYILENKLPVTIIPSMDHKDLPEFYRSLNLFVLPSFFEGFGCVFTEAWSCGTPFITCVGQGMDDLIYETDRDKWLCRQHDDEDLAKKILSYYLNRYEQRLSGTIDIVEMVERFMRKSDLILK